MFTYKQSKGASRFDVITIKTLDLGEKQISWNYSLFWTALFWLGKWLEYGNLQIWPLYTKKTTCEKCATLHACSTIVSHVEILSSLCLYSELRYSDKGAYWLVPRFLSLLQQVSELHHTSLHQEKTTLQQSPYILFEASLFSPWPCFFICWHLHRIKHATAFDSNTHLGLWCSFM